jgi:hypothetical protein
MDTIAYHQHLARLAHERGDYLSAARHYDDAAACYPMPEGTEGCRQLARQELVRHQEKADSGLAPLPAITGPDSEAFSP